MELSGNPLVRPETVRQYYIEKGLSTELLDKCNGQEFRYIDGYGKGYFLSTVNLIPQGAAFSIDNRSATLRIIDKLSLEDFGFSGTGLYLYVTAEPKYALKEFYVERNYNITIDKSLNTYGATTIVTTDTLLSMREVIEDFLPLGYTLQWFADDITSFDINIEGHDVLRAIDRICAIYGWVWTADSNNNVYVWDLDTGTPSSAETTGTLPSPINDIRRSATTNEIPDLDVAFPIYNYCRKDTSEYYIKNSSSGGQGASLTVMDPWYPAVANSIGSIVNSSLLDTRAALIAENLRAAADTIEYIVKHQFHAFPLSNTPVSLSEVHGDWGSGPRSIFRQIQWPIVVPKAPPVDDRYADNWIGELTDGYFGVIAGFVVTPLFGLDGKPPVGDQYVVNIYGWDYGLPGATVRVEWDCNNGRWLALQQQYECPPTEDPEYTPPGSPGDYDPYPFPPGWEF